MDEPKPESEQVNSDPEMPASPEVAPDPAPRRSQLALAAERLEGRVVPFWMISGMVSTVVLAALSAGAWLLFRSQLPGGSLLPTLGVVVLAVLAAWALIAPLLAWQRWRFGIDGELLLARYGIFYHEEKAIPISRMQHVDLTRGPIERMFGLATLIVFTAGTEGATFRVPGLTVERAQRLRDHILAARGDDVI